MIHHEEKEFYCPCGCGLGFRDMDEDFVNMIDRARGHAGVPFRHNSTIRCMKHNLSKEVGGSKTSSHPKGLADDIEVRNSYERFRILHGLKKVGFTRFGIYENFIHVDGDPDKPKELIWWGK